MLMSNGVTLIENLDPELLAKDAHERFEDDTNGKKAYIFLFVAQPLRCRGCSGSALAPIGLR
jgi:hypothetical protein